jgi:single-strand DNA-binding protein
MSGETTVSMVGRLTADPELRYTQSGIAVASLTIASNARHFDRASNEWKDGAPLFMRGSIWKEPGEHAAASLSKGDEVIATGRLEQRTWETKEGDKRTSFELVIDHIGPSLRHATAKVMRITARQHAWEVPAGNDDFPTAAEVTGLAVTAADTPF